MRSRSEVVVNYVILIAFAAAVVLPILWLLGAALSPSAEGVVDLAHLHLNFGNFAAAWIQADFGRHLAISLIVACGTVLVVALIAPLAGYSLALLRPPGGKLLFALFLAGIMIPLEGIIVPLYFDLRSYGLVDSVPGLLLVQIGLSLSFGVFWMRTSIASVPPTLIESAQLDGAGRFATLWRIVLPLQRPAMITLALLVFMWTWNDYFVAFVLMNNPDQFPVTVALGDFTQRYSSEVNLMCAAGVLIALPVVILYIFAQRHFISGVLAGALKG